MKRYASLLLGLAAIGCTHAIVGAAVPVEDDRSVRFPEFFEQAPLQVGDAGQPLLLEGAVLRALTLAADDFLPEGRTGLPCTERQASHVFRVIQREGIIFVRIDEDPAACGQEHPGLDSGARYAISRDGRILRRVLDGMEPYTAPVDAGAFEKAELGVSPSFDPQRPAPLPFLGPSDAGAPDAQTP
ncbi:hypothetical protein [Corallococcus llansteffanensis]|uniref:Lipoprotein n=1 Tax=Corallococcus llansteffanensis TaxID=2316731 RepID=A0A3A8PL90_9BACT|nr:hypothetical protein [Corallococcus llansteffanensis]RKH55441.1 hypothetical protein D7V93_22895 [Corallococcus llansteffanensis]